MASPSSRPAGILGSLALLALGSQHAGAQDESEFRERAARWTTRHGVALVENQGISQLVDHAFVRVELGVFELRATDAAFRAPAMRATLVAVAEDLVDLEETRYAWSSVDAGAVTKLRSAAKRVVGWIQTWPKAELGTSSLAGADMVEALQAAPAVREALAALRAAAGTGAPEGRRARLLLLPTREEFVEFAAAAALAEPAMRKAFWAPGPEVWTEYTFADELAVALEFGSPYSSRDYRLSIAMTAKNPRGLREHVAVLAAGALLDAVHEPKLEPLFAGALANELVIELFGEVDTRADGDLRAHMTPGRSVFVPGGKPEGGTLPPNLADSRWRLPLQGKDHFVGVLAAAQLEGGADASERWERVTSFALREDGGTSSLVVRAPFFGAAATAPPPAAFEGDYLEFLRAYRVAFLDWLRERAAPGANESHRRFAALLDAFGSGEGELLEAFERVYGEPLSGADARELEASLEGRFLAWLSHR